MKRLKAHQGDLFGPHPGGEAKVRQRLDNPVRSALVTGRNRLAVTGLVMAMAFSAVGYRVVDLTLLSDRKEPRIARFHTDPLPTLGRADIVDRHGTVLATSLPTVSMYADPTQVLDADEVVDRLVEVMPELSADRLKRRLNRKGRFVYLRRNLTPEQHYAAHRLGLPGIHFERGERRVYPQGATVAHVIGLTDVDGNGVAGLEKKFDKRLRADPQPLKLAVDLRIQSAVRQILGQTIEEFSALGGAALVMDAKTSELVAMTSLPDYDPNRPEQMTGEAAFNRATKGVYEMGSAFKLLTAAMALEDGVIGMQGGYDASKPMRVARFTISDYHAQNRWLSLPEILVHSSNIGAAKMALDVGPAAQKAYLGRLGLLRPSPVELPEVGTPLSPRRWGEVSAVTISYGHGISVTPVHLASAITSIVNGGSYRAPTLLLTPQGATRASQRVFSSDTSAKMRGLMRLVVSQGTGKKAEVPGYLLGGKTGTAEKPKGGRYDGKANITSFVGAFPIHDPQYVIAVMVDEPKGTKKTFGYATGGWVAAPAVGKIVKNMAGLLGIPPQNGMPELAAQRRLEEAGYATETQVQRAALKTAPSTGLIPAGGGRAPQ